MPQEGFTKSQAELKACEDGELIRYARDGHVEPFTLLVTRYYARVYQIVLRKSIVSNADDVRSVCNIAFAKAWHGLDKFDARSSFLTWVVSIAEHANVDEFRRKKAAKRPQEEFAFSYDASSPYLISKEGCPSGIAEKNEVLALLKIAINELPTDQRIVIEQLLMGLSNIQIASLLGTTVPAIKQRKYRAIKTLREIFRTRNWFHVA